MGRKKKTRSITVIGRRWFQKTYGNTYFSAVGYINGGVAVKIDFEYGYGDHYVDCIARELDKAGYLPGREKYSNGGEEALWNYCRERGIEFVYSVSDVDRKRDL